MRPDEWDPLEEDVESADLLDEYLTRAGIYGGLAKLDGILAAVVTAPGGVTTKRWMAWIFDAIQPRDAREMGWLSEQMLRRHEYVRAAIEAEAPELFVPFPEDLVSLRAFCLGYLFVAKEDAAWMHTEIGALELLPFAILGGVIPAEEVFGCAAPPAALQAELRRGRELLPTIVQRAFERNQGKRDEVRPSAPPADASCPCGSGNEYVRCCLS